MTRRWQLQCTIVFNPTLECDEAMTAAVHKFCFHERRKRQVHGWYLHRASRDANTIHVLPFPSWMKTKFVRQSCWAKSGYISRCCVLCPTSRQHFLWWLFPSLVGGIIQNFFKGTPPIFFGSMKGTWKHIDYPNLSMIVDLYSRFRFIRWEDPVFGLLGSRTPKMGLKLTVRGKNFRICRFFNYEFNNPKK